MNRTVPAALAVTLSLLTASAASADTRSWTAVKKIVGKGDIAVASIDISQLRSTESLKAGLQMIINEEKDAKTILDAVKSDCGFDITTALSDVTFVFQKGGDKPLIAFGLDGVDETKIVDCVGKLAGKMTGAKTTPKLSGKKVGKVTEYTVAGEPKKLYAAWLAKDVIAFTEDVTNKKQLEARLTGKGISPDLKKLLAKAAPTAAFWFTASIKEKENGRMIAGAHGKIELASGVYKGAGAIVMTKPADAEAMAKEGNEELAKAKTEIAKAKLAELSKAFNTVTLTSAGSEVVITGSIPDKDVAAILPQLEKMF